MGKPESTDGSMRAVAASRKNAEIEWSEELNARRCELIKRKFQGHLSSEEANELKCLQEAMRRYVNRVEPLPIESARKLHADLVKKEQANQ